MSQDPRAALNPRDAGLLRRAIKLSASAASKGNMPFGAVLADPDGNVLLEAENTTRTENNPLNHAETNLVKVAVTALTPDQLATATLYASGEPCAMCAGAMYSGGLTRLVYGMSELDFLVASGSDPGDTDTRGVGCRTVLGRGPRDIDVSGPHLVAEAVAVHIDFYAAGGPGQAAKKLGALDEDLLRRAFAVATRSVANGNLPFGALLADPEGSILLEAENSDITGRSPLNHAETNLMRKAVECLTTEQITTATLYTSCEPCAMCSGAMYWGGMNRLVYGMSEHQLLQYTGADPLNPTMRGIGCREILGTGQRHIEVRGPHLAEEASLIHRDFWGT